MSVIYPLNTRHLGELKFRQWAAKQGIDLNKTRTEPSMLVLKQEVKKSKTSYNWDIRSGNGNTDKEGEIRLESGDLFFATDIAIGLIKQDMVGVNGVPRVANTLISHYPDPDIFDGEDEELDVAEYECLEVIYGHGATLELRESGEIIMGSLPMSDFRRDPAPAPFIQTKDDFETLYPMVSLSGKSQFTTNVAPGVKDLIEGPVQLAVEGTDPVELVDSNFKNFIVLRVRGYLVKSDV